MYYLWVDILFSIVFILLILFNALQLIRYCLKNKSHERKLNEVNRASLNLGNEEE